MIGAHYDHLGYGEPGSARPAQGARTSIHYGADDNGSGTTGLIELARRFGTIKDRQGRRIVFVAFTGEERGLYGSKYYCNHPAFPLAKTAAMINLDMIGRLRANADKKDKIEIGGVGSAKGFEELTDGFVKENNFDAKKTMSGTGPSDHTSFYAKKVPVFFFYTGTHPEYHTPKDKVETINFDGMKKVLGVVEKLAIKFATDEARPEYLVPKAQPKGPGGAGGRGGVRIGIMPREYDETETKGVPVGSVLPGGAAEKAGILADDWIVEVAGKKVRNMADYMDVMSAQKVGQQFEIIVTARHEDGDDEAPAPAGPEGPVMGRPRASITPAAGVRGASPLASIISPRRGFRTMPGAGLPPAADLKPRRGEIIERGATPLARGPLAAVLSGVVERGQNARHSPSPRVLNMPRPTMR